MATMPKPFTFMADARAIVSLGELRETARRAEAVGIDALVIPDHLIPQFGPVAAMTAVAAVSDRLRVAGFVLNNDLRHPAVLAQELATIDVLSDGRLDVAIGAGWNRAEYEAIGLPFDRAPIRQARLAEAVTVLKGCFAPGPFSFAGEHYTITDHDGYPKPIQQPHPPFLIGGGGRRTLELAAREAQIVGLAPRILPIGAPDPASLTLDGAREKVGWVRAAAGERFDELVINVYPSGVAPEIVDDPLARARDFATSITERSRVTYTAEEAMESPHFFVGTVDGLVEKFRCLRDELGVSSIMVGAPGELDPVVERLAGT